MTYAFPKTLSAAVMRAWSTFVSRPDPPPALPPKKHLQAILETAFFASLEREEGRPLRFNLCCATSTVVPRDGSDEPIAPVQFSPARKLSVGELRRLAPAVAQQNGAILVRFEDTGAAPPEIAGILFVRSDHARARTGSGFYHHGPPYALTVEVRGPGCLHVYQGRVRLAYLERGKLVTPPAVSLTDFLDLYPLLHAGENALSTDISPPALEHPREWAEFQWLALCSTVFAVVNGISSRGHGGTLLLVGPKPGPDLMSCLRVKYGVSPAAPLLASRFVEFMNARHQLGDALQKLDEEPTSDTTRSQAELRDGATRTAERALADAIQFVAQLAAVDGALVMTSDLEVVGFGAEILGDATQTHVVQEVSGPFGSGERRNALDSQSFGMRHRSAIRFVKDRPTAVAFVVSQDGGVAFVSSKDKTVFVRRDVNVVNPNMAGA